MISKEEVLKYFGEMKKTELIMENTYKDLASQVKNEKYKREFEQMSYEERDHFEKITALEKLVDKI